MARSYRTLSSLLLFFFVLLVYYTVSGSFKLVSSKPSLRLSADLSVYKTLGPRLCSAEKGFGQNMRKQTVADIIPIMLPTMTSSL